MGASLRVLCLVGLLVPLSAVTRAGAQEHPHAPGDWSVSAQAIPLVTRVSPAMDGETYTEAYLTQPMVMGRAQTPGGALQLHGMLNLEGLTLRRGELNAGIWGEGYVDRRHPHTFLHEAVATLRLMDRRAYAASLSVGRGFVPFGTDDPMVRPLVKFPANHHLAQILERTVAVAALRAGPVVLEAGAFNGDEPEGPESLPTLRRFGDSWAYRLTLLPLRGVELQGSFARVASPEVAVGGGADQHKRSASLRVERSVPGGRAAYLLLEWASTQEQDEGVPGPRYASLLGEASVNRGASTLALRLERTDRPEEERSLDPFRTIRPHADVRYLGITRWSAATVAVSREVASGAFRVSPFAEVSLLYPRERLRPSFFVPEEVYGADRIWSVSIGARAAVGPTHHRAGRYGAAQAPPAVPSSSSHEHSHP